jgi:transcriptional regulator with XRE-family HTH domain
MFLPPFDGPTLVVGDQLRALRRMRRLSQVRLAAATGLDLDTVASLERLKGALVHKSADGRRSAALAVFQAVR